MADTLEVLHDHGIGHYGYGNSLTAASALRTTRVGDLTIGLLGFTDLAIDSPFYATANQAGIARLSPEAREIVQRHRVAVDLLVVSLHWGIEYFHLPSPDQISTARSLIDSGADLVVGHHPHVLQGIERYRDGLIAYSLGNFVFADIEWTWRNEEGAWHTTHYKLSRNQRLGGILRVRVGPRRVIDYELLGTRISASGSIALAGEPNRRIQSLSDPLHYRHYDRLFARELRTFRRRAVILQNLGRLRRVHKVRPHHMKEIAATWRVFRGS